MHEYICETRALSITGALYCVLPFTSSVPWTVDSGFDFILESRDA